MKATAQAWWKEIRSLMQEKRKAVVMVKEFDQVSFPAEVT